MTIRLSHSVLAGSCAALFALAACGGNSSRPGNSAPPPSSSDQGARAPQGAFGTIAAVTASAMEVQNQQSGQVTVNFTASTTFDSTVPASLSDVTVGSCVMVTAAAGTTANPTAPAVEISQPANNTCTRGGLFGGGGGGNQGRTSSSRQPNPSRQPSPSAGNNQGPRGAFGSVTAVQPNGFTVRETNPRSNQTTDVTVTADSSTTYTRTVPADSHALAVGKCVVALGPADDTGAVTARSITISTPGPNGCPTFGRGQGRRPGQDQGQSNGGSNG
ncbi:DUF5666 domain-containing protein [Saccharopolyspora phatthalungensis]|uniref:DUF5666 domain-containing protein n=1 Tax=Saccharopolyspora phatthalungensis TaxID=664693 RepID=A0A840QAQ1_9PSEU|nr:DUF5666 domain-containing protein [Saccharopolyspora phatthalungensis]MBB5157027.1 hypothetical protein [Saccharopolyspora phatthalungensis]